jgi:hypothetical protein
MQRYLDPFEVVVPANTFAPSKKRREVLATQGQIEPLLIVRNAEGRWEAADRWQGETLWGCRLVGFKTVLTEDNFTEDDLG